MKIHTIDKDNKMSSTVFFNPLQKQKTTGTQLYSTQYDTNKSHKICPEYSQVTFDQLIKRGDYYILNRLKTKTVLGLY